MYKLILSILGLMTLVTDSYSQTKMFTVDKKSKYELYFVNVTFWENEQDWLNDNKRRDNENLKFVLDLDTLRGFSIANKKVVNELSVKWLGDSTHHFLLCWYHYFIYVVKDGEIVDELRVNTECKQVVSHQGMYFYKDFSFDNLDKSNKISVVDVDDSAPKMFIDEMNKVEKIYSVKTDAPSERVRYFSKNYHAINKLVKKYSLQHKL